MSKPIVRVRLKRNKLPSIVFIMDRIYNLCDNLMISDSPKALYLLRKYMDVIDHAEWLYNKQNKNTLNTICKEYVKNEINK